MESKRQEPKAPITTLSGTKSSHNQHTNTTHTFGLVSSSSDGFSDLCQGNTNHCTTERTEILHVGFQDVSGSLEEFLS
jgi:hypothetical protein